MCLALVVVVGVVFAAAVCVFYIIWSFLLLSPYSLLLAAFFASISLFFCAGQLFCTLGKHRQKKFDKKRRRKGRKDFSGVCLQGGGGAVRWQGWQGVTLLAIANCPNEPYALCL